MSPIATRPIDMALFRGQEAPGPAVGDGLLLEDGTSFLLLESGTSDFLLLEG